MTAKITYTATAPDGTVFTRRTHRTYTHVVLVHQGPRPATTTTAPDGTVHTLTEARPAGWGTWGWAGRLDLAEKAAAKPRTLPMFDDVTIVPTKEA